MCVCKREREREKERKREREREHSRRHDDRGSSGRYVSGVGDRIVVQVRVRMRGDRNGGM